MSKFKDLTISELGVTITGKTPSSEFPKDFGRKYLFITPSDDFDSKFISKTKRYLSEEGLLKLQSKALPRNSILVSCIGSAMGKVSMNKGTAITNQQINSIVPNTEHFDNDYIYYLLKSNHKLIRNAATGSTALPLLNKTDFDSLRVNVHESKQEQQKIASVLSALDDKIELNNLINTELEQIAKALYDYWFVQFDFPNENDEPYKLFNGKMKYDEMFKREIPEGWEVRKMKDIANTGSGGTPKSTEKRYYENGNIPWINSGELNNSFIVSTCNFITELGLNNSSAKMFPANTILMAMYGATAGKTSIIAFEATTNQAICVVMPFEKDLLYYTKFVLDDMYQYLINLSTGSARDNLSQEKIRELDIIIPQSEIIKRYSKIVSPFFDKIKNNLQQNEVLSALRDWLLPMLMNGQVKVVGDTINDDLPKGSKKEAVNKKMV